MRRLWQPTGFRCECESGWGGARCDVPPAGVSDCAARPCLNGGSCREAPDGPSCECRPGFGGALCDRPADCRAAGCPPRQVRPAPSPAARAPSHAVTPVSSCPGLHRGRRRVGVRCGRRRVGVLLVPVPQRHLPRARLRALPLPVSRRVDRLVPCVVLYSGQRKNASQQMLATFLATANLDL